MPVEPDIRANRPHFGAILVHFVPIALKAPRSAVPLKTGKSAPDTSKAAGTAALQIRPTGAIKPSNDHSLLFLNVLNT
jgi:hypothetical protein